MEAIAGADAMKKPADVKIIEKVEIVNIRRNRARRRLGFGDTARTNQYERESRLCTHLEERFTQV